MNRLAQFDNMGNNCRLQGMTQHQAQAVIDRCAVDKEEGDTFWNAYFYGNATEIVSVDLPVASHSFIDEINSRPMTELKDYVLEQVRLLHKDGIPVVIPGCPLPDKTW